METDVWQEGGDKYRMKAKHMNQLNGGVIDTDLAGRGVIWQRKCFMN